MLNLGTTNYQIPESTSPFPFCARIFSGSVAPGTTITVNLVTQPGPAPPAGAQGLCRILNILCQHT